MGRNGHLGQEHDRAIQAGIEKFWRHYGTDPEAERDRQIADLTERGRRLEAVCTELAQYIVEREREALPWPT
jgi:hypothetical protein